MTKTSTFSFDAFGQLYWCTNAWPKCEHSIKNDWRKDFELPTKKRKKKIWPFSFKIMKMKISEILGFGKSTKNEEFWSFKKVAKKLI